MSNIIPFLFEGEQVVRVIEFDGEPMFVATDVARLLGYANPHEAIRTHCKGVRETLTPSAGGPQKTKIIPERDLYRLIMRSKLPAAERFEEWVVGDVLPAIRKTGGYSIGASSGSKLDLEWEREARSLLADLKRETNPALRKALHSLLTFTFRSLGQQVPSLEEIDQGVPTSPDILIPFWQAIRDLEAQGIRLNHAHDPARIALSLPEVREEFRKSQVQLPVSGILREALKQSRSPRFVDVKAVQSALLRKTVKCWVFDGWARALPAPSTKAEG